MSSPKKISELIISAVLVCLVFSSCTGRRPTAMADESTLATAASPVTQPEKSSGSHAEGAIFPEGISIGSTDVSGLTVKEAEEKLRELGEMLKNKTISINARDKNYNITYDEIDAVSKLPKLLEKVLDGQDISGEETISYDREKLKEIVRKIAEETNIPSEGKSSGSKLIQNELLLNIGLNINDVPYNASLTAEYKDTPKKKEDIKNPELMVRYVSNYGSSGEDRSTNIILATKEIDGVVLAPGEEFSFNALVGDTTREKGYTEGLVFSGGAQILEPGGGICQVSTALYNAVIRSGFKITDRHAHGFKVSYAEYGMDATVYYPDLDFKFQNQYSFPVLIKATNIDKNLIIEILGDASKLDGLSYEFEQDITPTEKGGWDYIEDPEVPSGESVIVSYPMDGAYSVVKRKTMKDGVEIKSEIFTENTYGFMNGTVKVHPGEKPQQ